jgi:peptide-methionine (S)-S-oxide reductase
LALETKEAERLRRGSEIFTEITPVSEFYLAEGYHQKYYMRRIPDIMKELFAIYPDIEDMVTSTAAARINGYLGGYGSLDVLEEEVDTYGLSPSAKERLFQVLPPGLESPACPIG